MILTEEQVRGEISQRMIDMLGKMEVLIKLDNDSDPKSGTKKFALVRRMKREEVKAMMEVLKSLDGNESLTEIHKKMRDFGYKGRITRKMIEDGVKEAGCSLS